MSKSAEPEKAQKSKPKKGEPVEIPIPKRKDFEANLLAAARKQSDDQPLAGDRKNG